MLVYLIKNTLRANDYMHVCDKYICKYMYNYIKEKNAIK